KKRSDESLYLHRPNVAGLRAKPQGKDGLLATRRGHVEHFIETLDDRDLADQLALLRLTDAEDLEETLRARQRAKARQGKTHAGTNKFRQKAAPKPTSASSKNAGAVRAIRVVEDSSESESDVSTTDQEDECRRVYLAEAKDRENHSITPTHRDDAADHPIMSQKNYVIMELDLLPGESRAYWKYHPPGQWFKQAKPTAKINNETATLLFDSGAEVSIVDSTFAQGRTWIKITLAGAYVYYLDALVGELSGQEAILGMDFMVPAGIRLDMADRSLCLPDEVRFQLSGRHQLFNGNSRLITFDQHHKIPVAGSVEIAIRRSASDRQKLWVTCGEEWAPTAVKRLGSTQYLRITNVSERSVTLPRETRVGIWLTGDHVPRMPGFVSIGSRRYAEWQNLALQATTYQQAVDEVVGTATEPMVDRPQYEPPTKILSGRQEHAKAMIVLSASAKESTTVQDIAGEESTGSQPKEESRINTTEPKGETKGDREQPRSTELGGTQVEPKEQADDDMDDAVCYHEGGDNFPEDIENNMAVLPEVEDTTKEATIDDIQVDDLHATPEERERLRRIIWKRRH
ncbi:hypothetical protein PHMEG_00028213, partial [Phytophthora megakarya]